MQQHTPVKAVVFDVGGVLLRTTDRAPRAGLAARFGMTYEEIDRFVFGSPSARLATVGEIAEEDHWQTIAQLLNLTPTGLADFRQEFWAGDHLDQELMTFIRALRPRVTTGLLSNAWLGARVTMRDKFKILDAFDVAIFSAEVRLAKPDAAIYRLLLERLDLLAHEVAFVDDFPANIDAACALGLRGILFRHPEQARADVVSLLNGHQE